MFITLAQDIGEDIHTINEPIESDSSQMELLSRLTEMVQRHSSAKQLSDNISIPQDIQLMTT